VNTQTASVSYFDLKGNQILLEKAHRFTPVQYNNDKAFSVEQDFNVTAHEAVYGLGQHQSGYMNYRGKKILLAQSNTEAVNPFYLSTNHYGILWDNYSKTIFEDDSISRNSMWSEVADNIDYYFVYGSNMDLIIGGYRYLTGQAPMYGKWAYGYWQSKEHYDTQDELMTVARKYRALKIPIDNIIQDWDYWYGNENWGSMEFHPAIFPKPDEMVKELHAMNYHMMISIWPAIGPNTVFYKDMLQKGFLYAPVGWAGFKYYDAYNPDANKLYWQYLNNGLVSKGIDAWWMDSTEPDVVNALTKESSDYELKKMPDNYLGTFARYLNPYSLVMTENIYKNSEINYKILDLKIQSNSNL
jgi:alpha-D-xyloside xylohydrolase